MFCSACGRQIDNQARFCPYCGNRTLNINIVNNQNESSVNTNQWTNSNSFADLSRNNKGFTPDDNIKYANENVFYERQQVYEGRIHKCPNCGNEVKAFETTCNICHFEFRDTAPSMTIREFQEKIQEIERTRVERNGFKSFFDMRTVTDDQIISLIQSFPIPNNKEDVLEFMQMAAPNAKNPNGGAGYKHDIANAWRVKFEQAYAKAKIVFINDKEGLEQIEIFRKSVFGEEKKTRLKSWVLLSISLGGFLLIIITCIVMENVTSKQERAETDRLNVIVEQIYDDIDNGNYDSAMIKAQTLVYSSSISKSQAEQWDAQRESIIDFIEKKIEEDK